MDKPGWLTCFPCTPENVNALLFLAGCFTAPASYFGNPDNGRAGNPLRLAVVLFVLLRCRFVSLCDVTVLSFPHAEVRIFPVEGASCRLSGIMPCSSRILLVLVPESVLTDNGCQSVCPPVQAVCDAGHGFCSAAFRQCAPEPAAAWRSSAEKEPLGYRNRLFECQG